MILVSPSWLKVSRTWIGTTALPDPIFVCDLLCVWYAILFASGRSTQCLCPRTGGKEKEVTSDASLEIGISVHVAIE